MISQTSVNLRWSPTAEINFLNNHMSPKVEFSDEPDDGLFAFLTEHPNRARLTHLAIEVGKRFLISFSENAVIANHGKYSFFISLKLISQAGPLLSSHLEALSSNCRALQNFRFIGFKVEDTNILKNARKDFKNLKALDICMYDCDEESSSNEEDDDDDESGVEGRSNIEVVLFFMESAVNLEVNIMK